jgi:D-glycero-D-manno-heptose 1,7-bisphosphate phosphatase
MGVDPITRRHPQAPRAVFLDRDGVLNGVSLENGRPHPPSSRDQLEILPGVPEALRALREAGYLLVVVTNQPDVARGTTTRAEVEGINDFLMHSLGLDAIDVCFHDDQDRCSCRKPAPGLLLAAAERFGIDLAASFMVGDRWRDIEAGRRAGCRTILVGSGYGEDFTSKPDVTASSLHAGAQWILRTANGQELTNEAHQ